MDNEKEKDNTKKYHFQGKSARLKGWSGLDHDRSERNFCTREPDSYTKLYKINIEGQDMETYQIFVILKASMPSNRHKNNKYGASIPPTKTNIDTVDKEGKLRKNVVKEATTSPISAKKNIDTVYKTDKLKTSKETVNTSKNNKTYTINSIDKSRSTPWYNLSNKSTRIENTQK